MNPDLKAQIDEARLYIHLAAQDLTRTERHAIMAMLMGESQEVAAQKAKRCPQAISLAQKSALRKLRRNLRQMRITCTADLISDRLAAD